MRQAAIFHGNKGHGMTGKNKTQNGFTLIEVMISVFIVSIIIFGMIKQHAYLNHLLDNVKHSQNAIDYADNSMENLKFLSTDKDNAFTYEAIISSNESLIIDKVKFDKNVTVTENSPLQNIKHVNMQISWRDKNNKKHIYAIDTYITSS